jgi:hypothetical protein
VIGDAPFIVFAVVTAIRVARCYIFIPNIPIWVKLGGVGLEWKMLVYIFYGFNRKFLYIKNCYLVYVVCGYLVYLSCFGTLPQDKSGNPDRNY